MNEDKNSVRSLLEKAGRGSAPQAPAAESQESEYTAFAHGRISRHPQLMLMLRHAGGAVTMISYSCLIGGESSDPAAGFTLDCGQQRVKITGKHLEQLLQLICQHRVAEVREASRTESFSVSDDAPLVETIEVQKAKT
jgi:hypothetical protein